MLIDVLHHARHCSKPLRIVNLENRDGLRQRMRSGGRPPRQGQQNLEVSQVNTNICTGRFAHEANHTPDAATSSGDEAGIGQARVDMRVAHHVYVGPHGRFIHGVGCTSRRMDLDTVVENEQPMHGVTFRRQERVENIVPLASETVQNQPVPFGILMHTTMSGCVNCGKLCVQRAEGG